MFAAQRPIVRRTVRVTLGFLTLAAASCGSGDTPMDSGPPTIAIALTPSSGTVVQGGSLTVMGSATIGGSFSGDVSFLVTGLPTGVLITVAPPSLAGSTFSAEITVMVGATVAPGTYAGTITASGDGISADAGYSLTVTAAVVGA
jgi:aminopeptidase S